MTDEPGTIWTQVGVEWGDDWREDARHRASALSLTHGSLLVGVHRWRCHGRAGMPRPWRVPGILRDTPDAPRRAGVCDAMTRLHIERHQLLGEQDLAAEDAP